MAKLKVALLGLAVLWPGLAFAGVTGKIAGRVVDAETGEPLIGANVIIEGTNRGAAAGKNGEYFILNVPSGTYTLRAQMIGYTTLVKQNIRVQIDLTTRVDFELRQSMVQGQEVVVVAERPLIQKDITAKVSIINRQDMDAMPISDFRDALKIQAGFTDGLHLRGGRLNSVGYRVDGMDVTNPLIGNYEGVQSDRSQTLGQADNQLFGASYVPDQSTSNYDGILLDKNAIQEIQVLTGTFNAEYGRAMSGVVNIVTRDPSPEFQFQLEYLSPRVNPSPYRRADAVAPDENPGPNRELRYRPWKLQDHFTQWDRQFLGQFRGSLSGAVPFLKNIVFFLSGRALNENSTLPFGYNIERDGFEKLVFSPRPTFKITLTGSQSRKFWQPYNHDWKYLPDNYSQFKRFTDRYTVELKHTLSASTFYTLKFSILKTKYNREVPGRKVIIDQNDFPNFDPVETDYQQPERWENGFFYRGTDIAIERSRTWTRNLKFDITSQVHPSHLVKSGIDILDHDIRQFTYRNPYRGGVHEYQDFKRRPLEIAAYIQDKIEYSFLIINLGLRMDYFAPNGLGKGYRRVRHPSYPYDNDYATMWPDLYLPGYIDDAGKFQYFPEEKVPAQIYISPRIGVAHPVTENLSLHFAYGHFVQRPDFRDIFYLHDIQRAYRLVGNPRAKIQKTIAFEFGVKQAIANLFSVDISVYYRDIFDLLGSQFVNFFPYQFSIINNSNYANAKGFEISIQKRYSSYFSANVNYTFLIATGNENTSRQGVRNFWGTTNDRLRPRRAFYLNWDRRHTIGGSVNIFFPKHAGPRLFNLPILENTQLSFLFQVKSGLPYTPTQRATGEWDYWLRILQTNSARRPWTYQLDMDLVRDFQFGKTTVSLFARTINLLNTTNALWVYTNTGRLWDAGPQSNRSEDYIRDPAAKGPPREIRIGLRIAY